MQSRDLDALLAELQRDKRSVRERLNDYLEQSEDTPETLPETSPAASPEPEPAESPETAGEPSGRNTRTRDVLVGAVLTVLAVIGVIAAIRYSVGLIGRFRTAHSQETAVERCLLPLVLMDIADFDSPDALSDEAFLTAAVWELAVSGKLTDYPAQYGMCTVPQADVTAAGNALFDGNRSPVCKTIGFTGDLRFYYDAEQQAYVLPCDPVLFTYIPSVAALTQTADGNYTARVDYYAEQPQWKQETEREPVKTVVFALRKTDTGWQVLSAKQTEGKEDDV